MRTLKKEEEFRFSVMRTSLEEFFSTRLSSKDGTLSRIDAITMSAIGETFEILSQIDQLTFVRLFRLLSIDFAITEYAILADFEYEKTAWKRLALLLASDKDKNRINDLIDCYIEVETLPFVIQSYLLKNLFIEAYSEAEAEKLHFLRSFWNSIDLNFDSIMVSVYSAIAIFQTYERMITNCKNLLTPSQLSIFKHYISMQDTDILYTYGTNEQRILKAAITNLKNSNKMFGICVVADIDELGNTLLRRLPLGEEQNET